ncbi:MAG: right-handed parallel beta-helix repeat-containing protein, partial [Kosmotogaceae bacterium]
MRKISFLLIAFFLIISLSSCTKYTFTVPDQEIEEGSKLEIELKEYASETLKEPLEFSKVSGAGYVYEGKYHYTPDYDSAGEHEVTVLVRDANKKELKSTFKITVIDVNHAPVGEIKDMRFMEGDIIELNLDEYFEDPDGDEISYEIIEGTGKIEERIYKAFEGSALPGIHPVRISVKDNRGNEISEHFVLIVEEKIASPVYDDLKTIFEVKRYDVLKIDLNEQLEDNEKGRFELVDGPGVLSYDGHYYYMPSKGDAKEQEVIFRVNSNEENGELKRFQIKVVDKTESSIIEVGTEEEMYSTIQSAINAAKAGDIVLVQSGTYEETLSITKGIILRGVERDSVVIKSDKSSNARIYIRQSNGFSIENLTIIDTERALMVTRSSGQIINCKIVGGKTAITYSSGKNDLLIKDSYISTLENEDVEDLPGERYYGIYAYGDGRLIIETADIKYCGTGLMATNDLLFRISDSRFDRNRIGISLAGDSTGYLVGNEVTRNEENGILINSKSIVTLNDNRFHSNVLHGLDLYLRMCTDCGCGGSVFRGTVLGENNVFDD